MMNPKSRPINERKSVWSRDWVEIIKAEVLAGKNGETHAQKKKTIPRNSKRSSSRKTHRSMRERMHLPLRVENTATSK